MLESMRLPLAITVAAALVPAAAAAQTIDTTYSKQIAAYTTDPHFLPASVSTLPASATVPSPLRYYGAITGAPGVMHHASDIYGYFRALAKATPRVRVETIGQTEEGRDIVLAIVTSDALMAKLDANRALLARLADPRGLTQMEIDSIARIAAPVYYLNAGLHSPEMGSPEMVGELAYRLAVSNEPAIAKIRDNVITIINPVAEPDGRDKQTDWYLHYTKGRPDFDDGFPHDPPYWGRYVVHDNNRDGIQISQNITHAITNTYFAWHPIVMHDLHESVPLLYISTGTGPYNFTNDPIIVSEWQLLANNDINALTAQGMPGVWTWGFFDGWWPGYGVWVANNHNSIGRFYETFGNAGADTYVRTLNDSYAGQPVTSAQWYRPWPPTRKVRWSSRDNINYMEAGVLASLGYVADHPQLLLHNFAQKGLNSMARGRTQTPREYIIRAPERQKDAKRAAYLVNQLLRQGIEVHRRTAGDSAGDYVVLLNQPYRDFAVNLLGIQHYPQDAQYPPYDDIAWTLGYLYGVDVTAVKDSALWHDASLAMVRDTVVATTAVRGTGSRYVLPNHAQNEILPALYWLAKRGGTKASAAESPFTVGTDSFPRGTIIFDGLSSADAATIATRWALPMTAVASVPNVARHALDLPRVAIYHNWFDTQDEGWSRYTFEQYGIPYTSIDKDDLKKGNLRARFDVILVPNTFGDLATMVHGVDAKWGPLAYEKTAQTPAFGTPDSSPDITGGPGFTGMAALAQFAKNGGEIITLANSTRMVADAGIASELSPHTTRTLFHPGSVVRARARRSASPILYGYPESFMLFRGNGPLYQVSPRDSSMLVAQYGTTIKPAVKDTIPMLGIADTARPASTGADTAKTRAKAEAEKKKDEPYVVSGMVRGESEIIGQGAIFDVPVGKGHVVAFTFDPLHRFLNQADFPLVWNAIMSWNYHPDASPSSR
jgi:hypothetical protein